MVRDVQKKKIQASDNKNRTPRLDTQSQPLPAGVWFSTFLLFRRERRCGGHALSRGFRVFGRFFW